MYLDVRMFSKKIKIKSNTCIDMFIRHGRYWQISRPRFMVAWNGIKMRCSNTLYFRKLSWNFDQFSSSALVLDTFYLK